MKKKEGWCFEGIVILAIAIALVAAVAVVAYTADLKTHVKEVGVRSGPGSAKQDIVYDNGMDYEGLAASQRDSLYPFEAICADDFQFDVLQPVNDVHWIGGYWDPAEDAFWDWEIKFYDDFGDGNKPGRDFVTYRFADHEINKVDLGSGYFEYSVTLPNPPLIFSPFTKYWISIQGIGIYPPQSGWGYHTAPILLHESVFKSAFFGYPDWVNGTIVFGVAHDQCFQLTYEEPFPDHKMHFPQYPDLIGWDVDAVAEQILSDDWQCSQTGYLTDIHLWGSWRNWDGNPWTDDFYTPFPYFALFIHRNVPADPDTPWSRPGEILWEWWGEIGGTASEPPTLESWFDPSTGELICNDHVPYWQYDFFFDQAVPEADSFLQYKDSVYWLSVAVLESPEPYRWGWKNSRDHFMDDAVWSLNPYTGPWFPIVEPPRCNWFDVYFDATGEPEDWGSTNYYSNGWYYYPEYGWWNMWFYDNPFTYDHPKEIFFDFWVVGIGAVNVAINWSTDIWSLEGVPGRPPLPGDFVDPPIPEDVYIGREPLGVFQEGHYTIPFTIPYNPEWISIDFIVDTPDEMVINGWIYHECVPTSMDMAFVITGEPLPWLCGDVNNDGLIDLGDVLYIVAYLYKGGPAPQPHTCVGDINIPSDDNVDLGDLLHLVSYLYKSGSAPNPDCCIPVWKPAGQEQVIDRKWEF